MRIPDGAYQAAAGAALVASSLAGVAALEASSEPFDSQAVVKFDQARPSDLIPTAFDTGRRLAELGGLLVIAAQGVSLISKSRNPERKALDKLGTETILGTGSLNLKIPIAALTVGSAVMSGAFLDIADEVNAAQVEVIGGVWGGAGLDIESESTYVISNSDTPELLSASTFPPDALRDLAAVTSVVDGTEGVQLAPVRYEWHTARTSDGGEKVQVLATSLPEQVTELPVADTHCDYVPVAAASELGAEVGETIDVEGLQVTVEQVIEDGSGLNLLPIIMNNSDFARCFKSNIEHPYSAILAEGELADIQTILESAGLAGASGDDLDIQNRLFVVPIKDFISNTEKTVKGNVNGLVMEAILLGLLFAGGSLSNNERTKLANNRRINELLIASGLGYKNLAKMYADKARVESVASTAVAAPIIILFDGMSNLGLPGASMGPDARTMLSVLGLTYGAKRVGSAIAIRAEKRDAKRVREHEL